MSASSAQGEAKEARQGASAVTPLVLVLFVILFSPLLYDLLREIQRLMGAMIP